MARALLQTSNTSVQTLEENGVIDPGTVQRRFGCNIQRNGNGITLTGEGYYTVDASVTVEPTAVGAVTVALYQDGAWVPGTVTSGYQATAGQPITLALPPATIRQMRGCCAAYSLLTLVLLAGAGDVTNAVVRVIKE